MKYTRLLLTPPPQCWKSGAAVLALLLAGGCSTLQEAVLPAPHPNYYSLADNRDNAPQAAPKTRSAAASMTLMVSPPQAAAGFDSQRIMYVRHAGQLEYFAYNEWVDTPARMLAPLI